MYRKIVWCYIIVLTLLDISLNTKLSAQGKSHGNGVSVHKSLMEGISLQEWGTESDPESRARAAGDALALAPCALAFGRRALAAAHALHVTITNMANETVHLASVAGTTPDFHASFFESKTLAPQANTTFSVVYLGRREGAAAAHLYIHTSKGVHKYPVSAVGVASEWRVWPLVALRVPHNATLQPLLTLYNPTDTTIQVREVYSSGAWLALALPGGGGAAPRAQWALPPHAARPLVRLAVQLPPPPHDQRARLTAYIRIKGNMTGGGLVVGVEATPAPAGEFLSPLQLRLRTRGSMDRPDSLYVEAGSSDAAAASLRASVTGACGPGAGAGAGAAPPTAHDKGTHNGAKADASGVAVTLLREQMEPRQELTRAALVTLDYAKMWAGYLASLANGSSAANGSGRQEPGAYCAGWVTVGRAALPYSLRVLPGTLALEPREMHFVTCNKEEAMKPQELIARNEFPEPLRITHVEFPPEVQELFHTESLAPLELAPGAARAACRLRLRAPAPAPAPAPSPALRARLTLRTNLTDYTLPLLLSEGTLRIEWEWPNSSDGTLRLGAVGASSALAVRARLHNAGAGAVCLTHLSARLPAGRGAAASFRLLDERPRARCVAGGAYARGVLVVAAGRRAGRVRGAALAHSRHGATTHAVLLRVLPGRVRARRLTLPPAAPYVPSVGPLELDNTMPLRMRVLNVTQPPGARDPALFYLEDAGPEREAGWGRGWGRVQYAAEAHCRPACYTGLQLDTPEGAEWAQGARGAGEAAGEAALRRDAALQRARYAMFSPRLVNFTLHVQTSQVVRVPAAGSVRWAWPRVWAAEAGGAARAGLCGVGGAVPLRLRARNPAALPLLLQPRLAVHPLQLGGEEESGACVGCVWSASSFALGEWRATRGAAAAHRHNRSEEYLLLQPGAEVEFSVTFAPSEPADLAAYLYLRNNLTILERVLLTGRGALPTFELGGRKPNSSSPILFEVSECGAGGAGVVGRTLALRNTGRVALRLRGWRLAGQPCAARAFRLAPCAAVRLQPGETQHLQLHYACDWTRARAQVTLSVRVGGSIARFTLQGQASARLLAACAPLGPRAPFEPELRTLALALAVLALIGAVGLGAADAERALRRHRAARAAPPAREPLDLRAIARAEPAPPPARAAPPPPPAPPARRRRPQRARGAADAAAERLAFSVWRAGGAAAAPRDDSRSSEEGERDPPPAPPPHGDAESSSPDSSPPPRDSYSSLSRRAEHEEGASSGDSSSSSSEGSRAPPSHPAPAGPPPVHVPARGSRQRREGAEARRTERTERKSAEAAAGELAPPRAAPAPPAPPPAPRALAPRKERGVRRRAPSPPSPPSPPAPCPPAPRAAPPAPPAPHASPRWGATWSDVVSRGNAAGNNEDGGASAGAALAPIGSDVRRRPGAHSLFYYGAPPAWPPAHPAPAHPAPAPAPAPPAATPAPPAPEESASGGYRSLESLWGSSMEPLPPGAPWLWGGARAGAPPAARVRPPPGFSAPRPVRPYDPFQSLASIWTPAALDWRLDASTPPPPPPLGAAPPPAPPLADDPFELTGNLAGPRDPFGS